MRIYIKMNYSAVCNLKSGLGFPIETFDVRAIGNATLAAQPATLNQTQLAVIANSIFIDAATPYANAGFANKANPTLPGITLMNLADGKPTVKSYTAISSSIATGPIVSAGGFAWVNAYQRLEDNPTTVKSPNSINIANYPVNLGLQEGVIDSPTERLIHEASMVSQTASIRGKVISTVFTEALLSVPFFAMSPFMDVLYPFNNGDIKNAQGIGTSQFLGPVQFSAELDIPDSYIQSAANVSNQTLLLLPIKINQALGSAEIIKQWTGVNNRLLSTSVVVVPLHLFNTGPRTIAFPTPEGSVLGDVLTSPVTPATKGQYQYSNPGLVTISNNPFSSLYRIEQWIAGAGFVASPVII